MGIPIIHVTGMDGVAVEPWAFRRDTKKRATMSAEELDRFRRRYDIVDEVKPIPGETVFKKVSPSAFWGTPLVGHLNFLGVDTIIACGESTSGCVRASVVDGTTNRLRMVVAEECVFDRHEACHAINLFDMNQKYADVLPLDDIIKYLDGWRAEKAGQVGYANNSMEYLKDLGDRRGLQGTAGRNLVQVQGSMVWSVGDRKTLYTATPSLRTVFLPPAGFRLSPSQATTSITADIAPCVKTGLIAQFCDQHAAINGPKYCPGMCKRG